MCSWALALRRLMMVASASIACCCWTKLGDGWSGDGMFVWLRTDFPTKRVHPIPYTK
jgi:hypothetical protein